MTDMPKITVGEGPSDENTPDYYEYGETEFSPNVTEIDGEPKEDDESAGNSTSTSNDKQDEKDSSNESDVPKPARTTVNPSSKGQTDRSTAPSTGGSGKDSDKK
jgi:hypothetical protein